LKEAFLFLVPNQGMRTVIIFNHPQGGTTMRKIMVALAVASCFAYPANAQNITNTLGSSGTFTIKDGSTTFFSLSQSNGHITLPATSEGSTLGAIYKGADRFIHNFHATGTNGNNTFVGVNAGNFSMSMSTAIEDASANTGVGAASLSSLTTGRENSGFGTETLQLTETGSSNTAVGFQTLRFNTAGDNNSALGMWALYNNGTGSSNSALGMFSLFFNTEGNENAAYGMNSLFSNTTGSYNSAFGRSALNDNTTGTHNSAFGYGAGSGITTGSNNICIGNDAQVPDGTLSNQVRMGNTSITSATIQVAWSNPSDRRWKSNIARSNLGLEFVSKLNPVVYTRNNDQNQRAEYGFIAQELESVLQEVGIENSGMLTVDSEGMYQLRYNDLLAPMVKAIQELKVENDELRKELASIRNLIQERRIGDRALNE
jgi:hypothetical protein